MSFVSRNIFFDQFVSILFVEESDAWMEIDKGNLLVRSSKLLGASFWSTEPKLFRRSSLYS